MDKLLTITEAAAALGVSKDTVRRRIKKGEIVAKKMPGPYGYAYYIDSDQLSSSQEIVEVLPIQRHITRHDLERSMQRAITPLFQRQEEQIQELREELAELRRKIEDKTVEDTERPWWKFWRRS